LNYNNYLYFINYSHIKRLHEKKRVCRKRCTMCCCCGGGGVVVVVCYEE